MVGLVGKIKQGRIRRIPTISDNSTVMELQTLRHSGTGTERRQTDNRKRIESSGNTHTCSSGGWRRRQNSSAVKGEKT